MARPIEPPVSTEDGPDWNRRVITRHPAYGQIGVSRVSGSTMLYGSDFQHQHYITLRIWRSELHRNLSNDHPFAREELIEVAMSEAQWATMVSSLNVGRGVPCTIEHIDRKMVPGLPKPADKRDDFKKEALQDCQDGLDRLDKLVAMIDGLKLSQKAKEELIKQAQHAAQSFTSSIPFVMGQFAEHMETTTEKAKIEINAYATHLLLETGMEALKGNSPLQLEDDETTPDQDHD